MGLSFSKKAPQHGAAHGGSVKASAKNPAFYAIKDNYQSIQEVQQALRKAGLESSNLILGIDFTKSNTWTGEKSFGGKCLHDCTPGVKNPYQSVIEIVGRTLEVFDDDKLIPTFGFGDSYTTDKKAFPFFPDRRPCDTFQEVISRYNEITPKITLAGPTNFGPIIREAIKIVQEEQSYHILVIIADGQVTNRQDTEQAIVQASNYPLSIIVIGVGDGPWETMMEYDDEVCFFQGLLPSPGFLGVL
uniref:VWFA domain-containing protein n=1 Tax=Hemiselmis tepida TaxID=464990 RepID=A0A7S0VFW0_9CRYP|mmetsp:Transcript_17830/g.44968  ORF Transcript_17830/g.44968 Transcript_17830/m.44968 type:complete len:245 (+) Transcript_17830:237-971(+)